MATPCVIAFAIRNAEGEDLLEEAQCGFEIGDVHERRDLAEVGHAGGSSDGRAAYVGLGVAASPWIHTKTSGIKEGPISQGAKPWMGPDLPLSKVSSNFRSVLSSTTATLAPRLLRRRQQRQPSALHGHQPRPVNA
jgi:hypothetical protein